MTHEERTVLDSNLLKPHGRATAGYQELIRLRLILLTHTLKDIWIFHLPVRHLIFDPSMQLRHESCITWAQSGWSELMSWLVYGHTDGQSFPRHAPSNELPIEQSGWGSWQRSGCVCICLCALSGKWMLSSIYCSIFMWSVNKTDNIVWQQASNRANNPHCFTARVQVKYLLEESQGITQYVCRRAYKWVAIFF